MVVRLLRGQTQGLFALIERDVGLAFPYVSCCSCTMSTLISIVVLVRDKVYKVKA